MPLGDSFVDFSDDDIKRVKKYVKPKPKPPLLVVTSNLPKGTYELISNIALLHERKRVHFLVGRKVNESRTAESNHRRPRRRVYRRSAR